VSFNNKLLGMRNIKTLQTIKVSGIPSIQLEQKAYLNLYSLIKERYRLMQESLMHEEKKNILKERIDVITDKIAMHHNSVAKKEGIDTYKKQLPGNSLGLLKYTNNTGKGDVFG